MSVSPVSSCAAYPCRGEKPGGCATASGRELTQEEERQVSELKRRDAEVRTHERAHVAAGGQYVRGGASFSYQTGPDGKRYAVGGEVSIDTSPEKCPRATIRKMQTVRKAALAPARPSGQDIAVAATASQQELRARQQLQKESRETDSSKDNHSNYDRTGTASSAAANALNLIA